MCIPGVSHLSNLSLRSAAGVPSICHLPYINVYFWTAGKCCCFCSWHFYWQDGQHTPPHHSAPEALCVLKAEREAVWEIKESELQFLHPFNSIKKDKMSILSSHFFFHFKCIGLRGRGLPNGTTKKRSPCHLEIASPNNATVFHGQEFKKSLKEQNWPCSLCGRGRILSALSITMTLSNYGWAYECGRGQAALSSECVMLPYDVVWVAIQKRCG